MEIGETPNLRSLEDNQRTRNGTLVPTFLDIRLHSGILEAALSPSSRPVQRDSNRILAGEKEGIQGLESLGQTGLHGRGRLRIRRLIAQNEPHSRAATGDAQDFVSADRMPRNGWIQHHGRLL